MQARVPVVRPDECPSGDASSVADVRRDVAGIRPTKRDRGVECETDCRSDAENSARIYIGAAAPAGIRPGDLVGAIANEAELGSAQIGGVEIEERFSLVEVPESMARDVIEALGRTRIKGQKVTVRLFRD